MVAPEVDNEPHISAESLKAARQIEDQVNGAYDEIMESEVFTNENLNKFMEGQFAQKGLSLPDDYYTDGLTDVNIQDGGETAMVKPLTLDHYFPVSEESAETTRKSREEIEKIVTHQSSKLMVVAGPCSIHSLAGAIEVAKWIKGLREDPTYSDQTEIIMRCYLEKPRTKFGWPGFLNDPNLDDSAYINKGIMLGRLLIQYITEMGVPVATERLNTSIPQRFNKLIGLDVIGARNVEDPAARHYAAGSSSPIGFKNPRDGTYVSAVHAQKVASEPHYFAGFNRWGQSAQERATGNKNGFVILRGGKNGPNYDLETIQATAELQEEEGVNRSIMIDCSHDNKGGKDEDLQIGVARTVIDYLTRGNLDINGIMLEANIQKGAHEKWKPGDLATPEKSITDPCLDLLQAKSLIGSINAAASGRTAANYNQA